jgi:hypothetical protein
MLLWNPASCPLDPVTKGNKGLRPRLNPVQSLRLGWV